MQKSRLERAGKHRELIILLHAFCQSPKALKPVKDAVRDAYPDADIYSPQMAFAGIWGWLCLRDATEVVVKLIKDIECIVSLRRKEVDVRKNVTTVGEDGRVDKPREHAQDAGAADYESIILIGHSMGAVLARKVAIIANGEQRRDDCPTLRAPFEEAFADYTQPRTWAGKIRRIVLIAGMNRGWTPSSAMDWLTSAKWTIGVWLGETIFGGAPIIFDIRQGAVFSIQTRLQWLALMQYSRPDDQPDIIVTQLLGTVDDLVSPDDSVDYAVDSPEPGVEKSYFYLEVPNSGHADIIDLRRPTRTINSFVMARQPGQPAKAFEQVCGEQRYVVFRRALLAGADELATDRCTVTREQMTDSLPNKPNWDVTDVVFVIHGIRDKGFWTQKIARAIKQEAADRKQDFRSVTASYGYFAMAPFVLWWVRKQKAEWLMDQYAEARAHYPRAEFSYVGHSNGTYLVARALRDYPAAKFKRIVLAGSVVRRDYQWSDLIGKRVGQVLNYVATGDWVVAIFPKGMQPIRVLDLGSAGHDGFYDDEVSEVTYIAGSHGAGHEERHWADIAKFIVSGVVPAEDAEHQSTVVKVLGYCSTGLLAFFAAVLLGMGFLIAYPTVLCRSDLEFVQMFVRFVNWNDLMTCSHEVTPTLAAARALATVLYCWVVYIVISRV